MISSSTNHNNGKSQTATELENVATKMENGLEAANKYFIKKMVNILNSIMTIVQRKEGGIFSTVIKWFRLYLKLRTFLNPDDKKLFKYYENSTPTIITYIIGCLQYITKEVPNYHYNLLEILEELLENSEPSVLKNITKFEIGTIGCLWNAIDLAGDFNTQLKALKILSALLRQFDEERQNKELRYIKWTDLNLLQDKLKRVVQETKLSHVFENSSRDLLNSYNMKLSNKFLVYSFYCKSVIMGNKYKFYKPLNLQKFWIDINYCPKTLSYSGRFKLKPYSKYENINVILKIQKIILQNNNLQIYFNKPGGFSNYTDYFSNIADNVIKFSLTNEEKQRLLDHSYVIKYFNSLRETDTTKPTETDTEGKSVFDILRNEVSQTTQEYKNKNAKTSRSSKPYKKIYDFQSIPKQNIIDDKSFDSLQSNSISKVFDQSPRSSRNGENAVEKHPIRKLRDKKLFFSSLLMQSPNKELIIRKNQRKGKQNPKSRHSKTSYKQVCKVTPSIDLTKIENKDSIKQKELRTKDNIVKMQYDDNFSVITTQVCDDVLKQVADIYETGDTTYAKPCQSYRNFQTHLNPIQNTSNIPKSSKIRDRKRIVNLDNESSFVNKKRMKNTLQENKENINPKEHNIEPRLYLLPKTKKPYLFKTRFSDETLPTSKLTLTPEKMKTTFLENAEIDLTAVESEQSTICCEQNIDNENDTEEHISSSGSLKCEQVRGLIENYLEYLDHIVTPTKTVITNSSTVTTPKATSFMDVSNLNDSDIEMTQVYCSPNQKKEQQAKNNGTNAITLQDNDIDIELIQYSNIPKLITERECETDFHNTGKLQNDCEISNENIALPTYLQQICNDFEDGLDDELDSSYKTPTKATSCHIIDSNDLPEHNYLRDCIVFQNRIDSEESSCSDEDGTCNDLAGGSNFLKKCKKSADQNFPMMKKLPLFLNQNLCQQTKMWTTPGKNNIISTNFTSSMASKCQVTPTAIIMHQLQVSEKKSIIHRINNPKKVLKANKSLNDIFTNKRPNKKSAELQKETFAQESHNLNNCKEMNWISLYRKSPTYTNFHAQQHLKTDSTEVYNISKNNNAFLNSSTKANAHETLMANPATEIMAEIFEQRQSISSYSNVTEKSENNSFNNTGPNISHQSTPLEDSERSFKNDLLQILNGYNTYLKLRIDNAILLGLQNISDICTHKFLEITKAVLKKSDAHKVELEKIRFNITRLMRELERQHDAFINKSKEFDIHGEIMERVLESMADLNIPNNLPKGYEDIFKQIKLGQYDVFKKVWQRYLERRNT